MIRVERLTHVTPADVTDLHRLLQMLSPGSGAVTDAHVKCVCETSTVHCFVARSQLEGDRARQPIVGTATLIVKPRTRGRTAELEDVVVDPLYRKRGVGNQLMQAVIAAARRSEVYHIDLTNGDTHADARPFYAELGFVPRDTKVFRLTLVA